MVRQQSGFTLVEMAVVLVIIGLLLGGVLKGQELINSAKAKSLVNDFRATATFLYGYQDRFRALPGDDAAADTHIGGVKATTGGTLGNAPERGIHRHDPRQTSPKTGKCTALVRMPLIQIGIF